MRIHVLAEDGISSQARTYAEYRLFAALSQLVDTEQVRDARGHLATREAEATL